MGFGLRRVMMHLHKGERGRTFQPKWNMPQSQQRNEGIESADQDVKNCRDDRDET
jgi:hypothetical protein